MQGGRDPFSGSGYSFGNIGGFGGFSSFGRTGGERRLISSFFGGDSFDDPFFGGGGGFGRMFDPGFSGFAASPGAIFGSTFLGSAGIPGTMTGSAFLGSAGGPGTMFGSGFLGSEGGPFLNPHLPGFHENEPCHVHRSRGPVIEELNSEDEKEEGENGKGNGKDIKDNPRKHGRSSEEPIVEDPDDEATGLAEKEGKHAATRIEINRMHHLSSQPQSHSFTFQSSAVSYGGANGAYYTSSRTRRTGSDGLAFEESKEADTSTGQATHRVSRGIHEKGHSITRRLKTDGHVDTMQTLHNLNEDELVGFDKSWKGNAQKHLPFLDEGYGSQVTNISGSGDASHHPSARRLPSTSNSNSGDLGSGRPNGRRGGNHVTSSSRKPSNGYRFRNQVRRN